MEATSTKGKPWGRTYNRDALRYPRNLTQVEWALVKPLIPPAKPGGHKREVDVREVVSGLLYVLGTGLPTARRRPEPGHQPASLQVHGDTANIMASMEGLDLMEQQFIGAAGNDLLARIASGETDLAPLN